MTFRRYAVWIIVAASVAGAALWIDHATKEAAIIEVQTQKEKDANAIEAAKQFNEQWEKSFDKTGKYPERQDPAFHSAMLNIVGAIYRRDARAAEAKELRDKFWERQKKIDDNEERLRKQRIENDASGRKQFADNLETTFLKGGRDLRTHVNGPKNTILDVQYVLFNRPAIYQLQNDTQFFQNAWAAGFKKIILRNGVAYGSDSWAFTAPSLTP